MTDAFTLATPPGPFTVLARDGVVVASGWTADTGALARLAREDEPPRRRTVPAIARAVAAYFDGDLQAIDGVAVAQRSAPFREAVWAALRATPPGRPATYAELAARCGRPAAARAAGAACAANACSLFVPCHRARRGDGALAGFLWGLPVKARLVAHEAGYATAASS
jgi:methylated-DNA-[protein]-cysteine S-methyltransferase